MKATEFFKDDKDKNILACKYKNEIVSLDSEIEDTNAVLPIDITTRDGRRVYQRGILYVMGMAFNRVYPKALLTVNCQLSNSIFCSVDNMKVTTELVDNIKKEMQQIVDSNLPIKKIEMSKEEAEKFYQKEKTLRGRLQLDNKYKDEVSLYFCENYYNYFYGVMPISTGYIKLFDVIKYHDGFLLRYPGKKTPDRIDKYIETKKLLHTLEEYEDIHRVLDINTIYKLNKKIEEGKEKELILLAEALHEKKISDIADKIVRKKGVKPKTPVVLLINRSLEMVISMLATLKVGAYYVAIDPFWPVDRTQFILQNSDSKFLITNEKNVANFDNRGGGII